MLLTAARRRCQATNLPESAPSRRIDHLKTLVPWRELTVRGILFPVVLAATMFVPTVHAQAPVEEKNMLLIGHNDLNGHGDGGELNQIPSPAPDITRCN